MITTVTKMIERQENKKHITTKERIASFFDKTEEAIKNFEQNQSTEIEWGKPSGTTNAERGRGFI